MRVRIPIAALALLFVLISLPYTLPSSQSTSLPLPYPVPTKIPVSSLGCLVEPARFAFGSLAYYPESSLTPAMVWLFRPRPPSACRTTYLTPSRRRYSVLILSISSLRTSTLRAYLCRSFLSTLVCVVCSRLVAAAVPSHPLLVYMSMGALGMVCAHGCCLLYIFMLVLVYSVVRVCWSGSGSVYFSFLKFCASSYSAPMLQVPLRTLAGRIQWLSVFNAMTDALLYSSHDSVSVSRVLCCRQLVRGKCKTSSVSTSSKLCRG